LQHRSFALWHRQVVRRLGLRRDAAGCYAAAFLNGLAWNALNITIVVSLLIRARPRLALA
jgi:hypothetical protein